MQALCDRRSLHKGEVRFSESAFLSGDGYGAGRNGRHVCVVTEYDVCHLKPERSFILLLGSVEGDAAIGGSAAANDRTQWNLVEVPVSVYDCASNGVVVLIPDSHNRLGKVILTGSIEHFFIESSDAILETAKGRVHFRVNIIDKAGKSVLYRAYSAYTEKHIGLGGGKGAEELIEKTIQETVNKLFYDIKFKEFLSQLKS